MTSPCPRRDLRGPLDRRSRRAPTVRSPARPCSRTCPPATSPSRKADYRRTLCRTQSARMPGGLRLHGGRSRRVDDRSRLGWAGADLRERRSAGQSDRFAGDAQLILADVDLDRLVADRARLSHWATRSATTASRLARVRRIGFELGQPSRPRRAASTRSSASRTCPPNPREPQRALRGGLPDPGRRACRRACESTGIEKIVIGVSGGLDSTQALIVAAARAGPARPAASERARVHDAGLRDERAHARQRAAR